MYESSINKTQYVAVRMNKRCLLENPFFAGSLGKITERIVVSENPTMNATKTALIAATITTLI